MKLLVVKPLQKQTRGQGDKETRRFFFPSSCSFASLHSLLVSLSILLLTACSPTSFRTRAIYEAIESGYRMDIVGWGEIDRELGLAYLGEFDVTFSPLIKGDTVSFSFRYPDKTNPDYYTLTWRTENGEQTYENFYLSDILGEVLAAAGYSTFHEGESEETYFAIEAIASGPQATIRAADAKYLKVIEVTDNYKGE
jgi:hypothetical protein